MSVQDTAPRTVTEDEAGWAARPVLARTVRACCFLIPVALAVLVMRLAAAVVAPPRSGGSRIVWLAVLMAVGWTMSWLAHRSLQRLLPLAALLEMSLCFPDGAPSRMRLAQRSSSTTELTVLTHSPVGETSQQAAERTLALITALARHDRRTRGHAERVRSFTDLIADAMGLSEHDRDRLRWASLLHDIGKLHVPASLLNSPDEPTPDEWEVLRRHPAAGALLAAPLLSWLAPMERVIEEHHERWDGTGYPTGRGGNELSLGSRIVQVADSFEVMTAARSYKRPVRKEAALRELVRCAGTQFDPTVVRALVAIPKRRLLWAMGPTAWIAGLPMLGQNTASLIGSTAAQVGTVTAAAAIGAASLSPAVAATSTPAQLHPPHTALQPARTSALLLGQHSHVNVLAPATNPPAPTASRAAATETAPVNTQHQVAAPKQLVATVGHASSAHTTTAPVPGAPAAPAAAPDPTQPTVRAAAPPPAGPAAPQPQAASEQPQPPTTKLAPSKPSPAKKQPTTDQPPQVIPLTGPAPNTSIVTTGANNLTATAANGTHVATAAGANGANVVTATGVNVLAATGAPSYGNGQGPG